MKRDLGTTLLWALLSAGCFHIAHLAPCGGYALIGFFIGLLHLTRVNNARHGFRWGVGLGWLTYTPHLAFFWRVFVPEGTAGVSRVVGSVGVFALWMVLPIWLGLFLSLATWLRRWTRPTLWIALIPVCWTGIEYFRGELYPLKFSWLSAGYAFADATWMIPFSAVGMYGAGFVLMLVATLTLRVSEGSRVAAGILLAAALGASMFLGSILSTHAQRGKPPDEVAVGGVQLEFPTHKEVVGHLDRLLVEYPETELCVLSEYTFDGPVPETVRQWCRDNKRHLIAGGKDPLGATNFYNTAFVVGSPEGDIVFKQVKSVPIQFFADGLPASEQRVWQSPWGNLGLCICYDLGYTRVTDTLVRQGAQAIIAPTMDVADWGGYQHRLHARVAPIRAAEYSIPIFRLTSSGISQHVLPSGTIAAERPYPGQGEILAGVLDLSGNAGRPADRWFAPGCVAVTGLVAIVAALRSIRRWLATRHTPELQRLRTCG